MRRSLEQRKDTEAGRSWAMKTDVKVEWVAARELHPTGSSAIMGKFARAMLEALLVGKATLR